MKTLGIIGYGSIARTLLAILRAQLAEPLAAIHVLTKADYSKKTKAALLVDSIDVADYAQIHIHSDSFFGCNPDLVIECAGHGAVQEYATLSLLKGIETIVTSVGSLTDVSLYTELIEAADKGRTHLVLPAGAVGGIDVLAGASMSGVRSVIYSARKPPLAWKNTPAEDVLSLEHLMEPAVFYEGNAREAARDYPKNANVAATIALAGAGFEKTRVRLIADPNVTNNVHEYEVTSEAANVFIRIEGRPSPTNAKTSLPTAYSLAREVINRVSTVTI